MAQIMMGAFRDPAQADQALRELEARGYTPEEMSIISKSNKYEVTGQSAGSQVAQSVGAGATTGGVLGGLAGLLVGIGVMPALAGIFIGGPIVAALGLAGAAAATVSGAVTGATAGGLIGALTSVGLSKETAISYNAVVEDGGVLLGLSGRDEMTDEARETMEQYGAKDISVVGVHPVDHSELSEDTVAEAPRSARRAQPVFGEHIDTTRS